MIVPPGRKTSLPQDPVNYDALFLTGVLSSEKGEARQAARTFNQLASIYNRDAKAKYQLAVAYFLAAKKRQLWSRVEMRTKQRKAISTWLFNLTPILLPRSFFWLN